MQRTKRFRTLFIVGCPRSGTTWVQLLLARHPEVATAPETQIVAYYLSHFRRQWEHERRGAERQQGAAGLSRLLDEDGFRELCRLNVQHVLERIAATSPGASLVVEKSPLHAVHAEFIHGLLPDAYFLHVIRDPRDTVASLLAAGRSWGRDWAPRNPTDAARFWVRQVTGGRRVARLTDRYREVRYEALLADPVAELEEILAWLDLSGDRAFCEAAVAACDFDRLRRGADGAKIPIPGERSPAGFFRRGTAGAWRTELSRSELRVVERICGATLREIGYEPTLPARRTTPLRITLHDALHRVREAVDWQLQRLVERI